MRDPDLPLGGNTPTGLPPLGPSFLLGAEGGGDFIDQAPGEVRFDHAAMIGQYVQPCQDTVSQEGWTIRPYPRRMAENRELEFNEHLCARVHRLRNDRGWTAEQMATALGVPPERYRKYEYRSPLPHYLIAQFAQIVGREVEYVLTGKVSAVRAGLQESPRKRA